MCTAEPVIHKQLKKKVTIKCRHNKVESMYSAKKCNYRKNFFLSRFLSDIKNGFIPLLSWNASWREFGSWKCIF